MSACHSLRFHLPLKTVLGKIGDTYKAYCNTYKTHAMATHHGGSGNLLDRDIDMTRETQTTTDNDIGNTQDFHPVEMDHFEDLEHNNPTKLTALTREGQPTESLNCIECELQRLSISLNSPAPPEHFEW